MTPFAFTEIRTPQALLSDGTDSYNPNLSYLRNDSCQLYGNYLLF